MTRPNILLIITDQHRGDSLSCEDHPAVLTPHLDWLAARGTRFTHAYSPCPICIPARRSLMAGQFPATHGMLGFADRREWFPRATLPGVLRDAGYHTQMVGRSMHLWPKRKRYGFDHVVISANVHAEDDVVEHLPGHGMHPNWGHGLHANGWTARPWHLADDLHPSHRTADDAIRFFERRDPTCPFFLVAGFTGPHPPLCPPAFYLDRYLRMDLPPPAIGEWATRPPHNGRGLPIDSPLCCLEGEALRSCHAGYYGLINHIDDQIGRMLMPFCGISRQDLDNTIVVFTSDHGEMLGDHYMFRKSRPYEGSLRVPFLISAPRWMGLDAGLVRDEAVSLEDLMPTLLELAGVPIPDSVDGRSLAPLLRSGGQWDREFVHAEHASAFTADLAFHALTDGRFKYIWSSESGREQLFDLRADPRELTDLHAEPAHADRLTRWRQRLIEKLAGRPEGFVQEGRLVAGRPHAVAMAHISAATP